MLNGLSFRAAARRVGCTHKAISDAVASRRLSLLPDGSLAPDAVDTWNRGRRAPRTTSRVDTKRRKVAMAAVAPTPPAPLTLVPAAVTVPAGGLYADRASAELARDSYAARLRQLEFEQLSRKLLDAEMVRTGITSACVRVRTRLLAIPAERAPALVRLQQAAELQAALHEAIVEALEELVISFDEVPL